MRKTHERLAKLGLELPAPPTPAAHYAPFRIHDSLLFVAGQLPVVEGRLKATGILGREIDIPTGQDLARIAALNALAVGYHAIGSWQYLRVAQLTVFVASDAEFYEQHRIADGASDLLVTVLEDEGRHARTAVAAPALPLNSPVEVQVIFGLINNR